MIILKKGQKMKVKKSKEVIGIEITDNFDYACGNCFNIMEGDENICPSCGKRNHFDNPLKLTENELIVLSENETL